MHSHQRLTCTAVCCLLCAAFLVTGCGVQVSDEIQAMRKRWLAESPPAGEMPISEIRSKLADGDMEVGSAVVVRARVNAGAVDPWTSGQAAFIITDAIGHDGSEDPDHDPHECPFCRRDVRNSMAVLRFVEGNGKVVSVDARQLFDISSGELLVAEGTVSQSDADGLTIDVNQMHVVRRM